LSGTVIELLWSRHIQRNSGALSTIGPGRMSLEIERKFLVCGDDWRKHAISRRTIRQAYLAADGKASVRVRIIENKTATLTVKARAVGLRRLELEYPVPMLDAEALIPLRRGSVIEKERHVVPWGDLAWEIDVFSAENAGLVIAEIELRHEDQRFELPNWIGAEVTGQTRYYNSSLAQRPFRSWPHPGRMDRPHGERRLGDLAPARPFSEINP
jgi:adenylate cyclase